MKPVGGKYLFHLLLIGPAILTITVFMIIPLLLMVYISFQTRDYSGGVLWGDFSYEAYLRLFFERQLDDSLALNLNYMKIILNSVWLAFFTMVCSLLVGLPVAMFMATRSPKWKAVLVFMVTLPFWTNLLVRNYAWILLLRDHGTINSLLLWLGIISEPAPLLYTEYAVAIGLTYSFLPFMVLPIYASLEKIDLRLVEASFDLYAGRFQTIKRVILPLAYPGIIAGCILVFVPALGSYVTPELLGGGKTLMIGNLIGLQFGAARNWPFGATLGLFLLILVLASLSLYARRYREKNNQ